MKKIKKWIFVASMLAIASVFMIKATSNAPFSDLLDQNIEALANNELIITGVWVQSYWVNVWTPGSGRLLHTTTCEYKYGHGNPAGQCSAIVIVEWD